MSVRALVVALTLWGAWADQMSPAEAAGPAPRIRIIPVRKGAPEVVGNGYLTDPTATDQLIFILVGNGSAKLTLYDADAPGDTVAVDGAVIGTFSTTFSASATSPDQIVEILPITYFAVVLVDVRYTSIINPLPAQYIYKLKF
uniref:Uncharacterized protein n=1 Tax=Schlesneria paludicola TaxID=360056 RepID=A0A7C4LME5_9PLAN